jgi:hypothetical protein
MNLKLWQNSIKKTTPTFKQKRKAGNEFLAKHKI